MARFIVLLCIVVSLAWTSEARGSSFGELNPPHPALVARAPQMEAVMRSVDASDRTTHIWWNELKAEREKYKTKTADEAVYCSSWEDLLDDLNAHAESVDLVKSGLDALGQQLKAIKDILSNTEYNGKSGLHCDDEDSQEEICKALKDLDETLKKELVDIEADLTEIKAEKHKVETFDCDCKYNEWKDDWSKCLDTTTGKVLSCGEGEEHETRDIMWKKRNNGADCDVALAKRTRKCNAGCCPVNCEWEQWGEWGACPDVCTSDPLDKQQTRDRKIKVAHECGGTPCKGESSGTQPCDILQHYKDKIEALEEKCPAPGPVPAVVDTTTGETKPAPVAPVAPVEPAEPAVEIKEPEDSQ